MKMPRTRTWRACAAPAIPIALAMFAAGAAGAPLQPESLPDRTPAMLMRFLQERTAGLPGRVAIAIDPLKPGALPPCAAPEPFLPGGARLWGRVSVGLRCDGQRPWTRYISATIAVTVKYYAATRPIVAGQALTAADFAAREGDLATLPRGVVTDAARLEGMVATGRIAADAPLRQDLLRGAIVVKQGQMVKLLAQGPGFSASTEARAMTDGAAGAAVQLKTAGGQLVSGIVRDDGAVELPN